LEIQAGEGGRESQACSEIIQRMYLRFATKNKWKTTEIYIDSNEDGIRKAIWKFEGKNVNILLDESGNHRFTRYSPYSKDKKLHTSFVGVKVEEFVKSSNIILDKNDVTMSFFKGSGAGGQHRNKVETGVRLVHLPTGIVVESVSERSQHHNRDLAWERLSMKVQNYENELKDKSKKEKWKGQAIIGFGERRRTYKLEAGFIKDEKTGKQINQVQKILNGDLENLIN